MPTTTFASLPPDIVDRILTLLPNFRALSAALRASKSLIYNVFLNHPLSITHAIAYNLIGPALPQALRIIQIKHWLDEDGYHGFSNAAPEDEIIQACPLTRLIGEKLEEYADVASGLEDLFSLRFKNRLSKTSLLTPQEALRFHRALYRTWACTVINAEVTDEDVTDDEEEDEDQDDDDDDPVDPLTRCRVKIIYALLNDLSTTEIREVYDLVLFLNLVARWVMCEQQVQHVAVTEPNIIWYAFSQGIPSDLTSFNAGIWDGPRNIDSALSQIWTERKVRSDRYLDTRSKAILEEVEGENAACERCGFVGGLELWGPTNLILWLRNTNVQELSSGIFLPGLLSNNRDITDWIKNSLIFGRDDNGNSTFDFEELMNGLVDIGNEREGAGRWSRDRWYCNDCVGELFRRFFWRWILLHKTKRGETIHDDCWYGYNCRTMTHRLEHARKLNHLCIPTRGEGAGV
ncbi:hypothetical protein BXZ70DRAFT_148044 [Cristinia sonorae]|uniref:F-box domain-containing protein n=1 Tax=Cristinia sonorae TaxID=1940300 RepID=A0A8K0XQC0_9AGAR|nr:hypothetical protein BXZ70DRAFT_148044 [Cristinia sonorae]